MNYKDARYIAEQVSNVLSLAHLAVGNATDAEGIAPLVKADLVACLTEPPNATEFLRRGLKRAVDILDGAAALPRV